MADPAPSLYRLYDHDALLEEAIAAQLEQHGVVALHSRSTDDRKDTCAVLEVTPGAATGHASPDATTNTGGHEEDWFQATATLQIQTEREEEPRSAIAGIVGKHAERVARARVAMLRGSLAATFACDYLDVVHITFGGMARSFEDNTQADVSTLVWTLQYRIRTDAWPAS